MIDDIILFRNTITATTVNNMNENNLYSVLKRVTKSNKTFEKIEKKIV